MAKAIAVTDDTFEELVLKSEVPALVDFWAVWCNPCKMIAPTVEEIAAETEGTLVVAKVDVDTNPVTPGHYGVMGIPTLILFVNGQPVERLVGVRPKDKLMASLRPYLKNG
ncbi:MAG TPA: thioredoxin [Anaerolineae bacterium]|nr:thioredoxin [Anaerolineae bacterium]